MVKYGDIKSPESAMYIGGGLLGTILVVILVV
jgi:hypothetical protein